VHRAKIAIGTKTYSWTPQRGVPAMKQLVIGRIDGRGKTNKFV